MIASSRQGFGVALVIALCMSCLAPGKEQPSDTAGVVQPIVRGEIAMPDTFVWATADPEFEPTRFTWPGTPPLVAADSGLFTRGADTARLRFDYGLIIERAGALRVDTLLVLAMNTGDGESGATALAALDARTLTPLWQTHVSTFGVGPLARAGDIILASARARLLGVATGEIRWRHEWEPAPGDGRFGHFERVEVRGDTGVFHSTAGGPRDSVVLLARTGAIVHLAGPPWARR